MADESRRVAGEHPLRELADHRLLDIGFGDHGAIDELAVARSPSDDPSTLESRDECRDGGLGETPLVVERLPYLGDGGLATVPEQAENGELELGELVTFGHGVRG